MQKALREERLDGWLFCNIRHQDIISDTILRIPRGAHNSRLWVYAVPAQGEPYKIVPAVEKDILSGLAGSQTLYASRSELAAALAPLAGKVWGVQASEDLPAISYLDAGSAALFAGAGLALAPAGGLIQRFASLLDEKGAASHEKAVAALYEIVMAAWEQTAAAYKAGKPLYEGQIRKAMLEGLAERGMITSHPPIVGAGVHSADPHYDFCGAGAALAEGDVVQFDIWGKEDQEGSIYGDISWAGVFGASPPSRVEKAFAGLIHVREEVCRFIDEALSSGSALSGAMVDAEARALLTGLGYGAAIKHRLGHSIDTACHGFGVNLDSVEFPDPRPVLEGSCFSLEPGIYFSDFGLRTEINGYILQGKLVVSGGGARQSALLAC
ncbi:MAG: aminopeptidase P family protein [Spirochaetaceae bacterium]|jgi:Xaa-Pro aminopeptidase|nr:aminopeptidase P family protein [Spirochaetaceae bacterium]